MGDCGLTNLTVARRTVAGNRRHVSGLCILDALCMTGASAHRAVIELVSTTGRMTIDSSDGAAGSVFRPSDLQRPLRGVLRVFDRVGAGESSCCRLPDASACDLGSRGLRTRRPGSSLVCARRWNETMGATALRSRPVGASNSSSTARKWSAGTASGQAS